MNKIKVRFLGTNGWYDTQTGNTICVLIETPHEYVILDAGNGLYKIDQYIKTRKPIYLFLSHFHFDHIEGLHILAKFRFRQGMTILVQTGGKKLLDTIIRQPFTLAIKDLKMKTKVVEIPAKKGFSFLADTRFLRHISSCIGMRFNFNGKIISYIPDTGVCENAYALSSSADLVIAECAMKVGMGSDDWPHLNPESAAMIAKSAGAKKLALVHFDAEIYQNLRERDAAGKKARKIFRNTFAARDDQTITL